MVFLNPLERANIQDIMQHAGSGVDTGMLFSLLQGTIEGAQQRRQETVAQRRALAAQYRDQAMQLAAQGATESAVQNAIGGMAENSMFGRGNMGDERVGRLMDYVGGLYDDGPVSGLAPADYRAQFDVAAGLDDEDRAAVGQLVLQGMQQGTSFREIAQQVQQQAVATGQDEVSTQALMNEAESAYERLIGSSLEDMRGFGAKLRSSLSATGGDEMNLTPGMLAEATGLDDNTFAPIVGTGEGEGGRRTVESFLAQAVNDPQLFRQLMGSSLYQERQQQPAYSPSAFTSNRPGTSWDRFGFARQ